MEWQRNRQSLSFDAFPYAHSSQGWDRNSMQISHVCESDPRTWTIVCFLLGYARAGNRAVIRMQMLCNRVQGLKLQVKDLATLLLFYLHIKGLHKVVVLRRMGLMGPPLYCLYCNLPR